MTRPHLFGEIVTQLSHKDQGGELHTLAQCEEIAKKISYRGVHVQVSGYDSKNVMVRLEWRNLQDSDTDERKFEHFGGYSPSLPLPCSVETFVRNVYYSIIIFEAHERAEFFRYAGAKVFGPHIYRLAIEPTEVDISAERQCDPTLDWTDRLRMAVEGSAIL